MPQFYLDELILNLLIHGVGAGSRLIVDLLHFIEVPYIAGSFLIVDLPHLIGLPSVAGSVPTADFTMEVPYSKCFPLFLLIPNLN